MAYAIEKHMLEGGDNNISITSQNVFDGIVDNPMINYMVYFSFLYSFLIRKMEHTSKATIWPSQKSITYHG